MSLTRKVEAAGCVHCGRPVGDDVGQCRPARGGWFCWQNALILDASMLAPYIPAPIGPREQGAIDRYAPRIADAEKAVDERLASYTVAEMAYHSLYADSLRDRVSETKNFMGAVRAFFHEDDKRAQANEPQRKQLEDAKQAFELTKSRLSAARLELHRLQRLQEIAQIGARHGDALEDGRITRGRV